jgi:hypothetical protein
VVLVPTYTEEFRRRELQRGRRSLFYFGVSILGFCAPDPDGVPQISDVHRNLAEFLEGRPPYHHPWRRALVCMARGVGKSVWTTQTYPLWRGLYIPNFSTKIIENSSDNAKRHHFVPLVELFTSSPRADYLQWMFQHRLPPGFEGWTAEQIKFVQTDPLANPAISYWGVESKFEGAHPDLVVLDDPEGADAQKSVAANREAWTAYQSVIPLLKHPLRSQILIVATPHGDEPVVWKLRDRECSKRGWQSPVDNARDDCEFKILWEPILNGRGESIWPERFPLEYVLALSKEDVFPQQYMLRRSTSTLSLFDMTRVLGTDRDPGSCYTWEGADGDVAVYPGFDYEIAKTSDPTYRLPPPVMRAVHRRDMRYHIHFDPLHRAMVARKSPMSKQRPAEAAVVVVGVAPDFHPLCVDHWNGDGDIDAQLAQLFRLYRTWCPAVVTYEAVGAQTWVPALVRAYEAQSEFWRHPYSTELLGPSIELPRMSLRMVESSKTNEAKETIYREVLSSWINRGILHFARRQEVLLYQLTNVLNQTVACDLVDCLAQGPEVWAPPVAADRHSRKFHEAVAAVNARLAGVAGNAAAWVKRSGYAAPWQGRGDRGGG